MDSPHPIGSIFEARIESVAFGGKGIARVDGMVCFVEGAIPQDRLRIRWTEIQKRYGEGEIVEILEPSPLRGVSPCPVSDVCGGCQWQGVAYSQQMEWKSQFVTSALQRIGKLAATVPVHFHPSPRELNYRNRVHLKCQVDQNGRLALGYFQRASHHLVAITHCPIAESPINDFISFFSAQTFEVPRNVDFRLEIQILPATLEAQKPGLFVVLYPNREQRDADFSEILRALAAYPQMFWSGKIFDVAEAPAGLFEVLQDSSQTTQYLSFPGQFQQVNRFANHKIRDIVLTKARDLQPKRVFDLFSGSGNFSLPLAQQGIYVEGIEFGPGAVACAKKNLEINNITGSVYLRGDVEKHLWKCAKQGERFDLIIADPPREGMYKALVPLKKIAAPHLFYISCDPTTLARDLGSLTQSLYEIREIQVFDFFPQTFHVETLVILTLSA